MSSRGSAGLLGASILGLGAALALLGCGQQPAGREAYAGQPVRAAINAECGPELVDAAGEPCVQIDVFAEGEGEAAAPGDWLALHYIAALPDGSELDSSHGRKPLRLELGESSEIIAGMHIGLAGMRVGERRRFVVPPALGYRGRKMAGLPPDADLTFFVELVERRDEL